MRAACPGLGAGRRRPSRAGSGSWVAWAGLGRGGFSACGRDSGCLWRMRGADGGCRATGKVTVHGDGTPSIILSDK